MVSLNFCFPNVCCRLFQLGWAAVQFRRQPRGLALGCTGLGAQPSVCCLTADASHRWGSDTPVSFSNSLSDSQWLRKLLHLWWVLFERTHAGWGLAVSEAGLPCPLPLESGCVTLLAHQRIHQLRSSSELWGPEFLSGFQCLDMID